MINNLKAIIKDKNINLSKMSKSADISRALLTKLANEDQMPNVNLYSLLKISEYLNVPIFEMYYPKITDIKLVKNITLTRNPNNTDNKNIYNFYDFYYSLLKLKIEDEEKYLPVFMSMKSGKDLTRVLPEDPSNFISIEFKLPSNDDFNYMKSIMNKEYNFLDNLCLIDSESFQLYINSLFQISTFLINNISDISNALNNNFESKYIYWDNSIFEDNALAFGNIIKKENYEIIPDNHSNTGTETFEGLFRMNEIRSTRRRNK